MKKTIVILILVCATIICFAQTDLNSQPDSLALESRVCADVVLSHFDAVPGKKILYSLKDKYYYLIFQHNNCYKEFFVVMDSMCTNLTIKEVKNDANAENLKAKYHLSKRKSLKKYHEERQIICDAFDTSQYSAEFITTLPNATYVAGTPSYFVLKDEDNKRYGEYSLSSIVAPSPINPVLWAVLFKRIMENIE